MAITSDHAIVDGVPKVYQFAPAGVDRSLYRCVAFVLASLIYFASRGKYPNLDDEAHKIYEQYAGPDVKGNTNGLSIDQAKDCLHQNGIGYIDLQHFIDAQDWDGLRHEMACMNRQGVPQLITIADESHLKLAGSEQKLHNWNDANLGHCIARLGMDERRPNGYYLDPACPTPPFPFPTPITWQDIHDCNILHVLAIMPHNVVVPPSDFRYYAGANEDGTDKMNAWPEPKPVLDVAAAIQTVEALRASTQAAAAALEQERARIAAEDQGFLTILRDLGLHV